MSFLEHAKTSQKKCFEFSIAKNPIKIACPTPQCGTRSIKQSLSLRKTVNKKNKNLGKRSENPLLGNKKVNKSLLQYPTIANIHMYSKNLHPLPSQRNLESLPKFLPSEITRDRFYASRTTKQVPHSRVWSAILTIKSAIKVEQRFVITFIFSSLLELFLTCKIKQKKNTSKFQFQKILSRSCAIPPNAVLV